MLIQLKTLLKAASIIISAYKIAAVGIPVAQAAYGIFKGYRNNRADMKYEMEAHHGNKIRRRDIQSVRAAPKSR